MNEKFMHSSNLHKGGSGGGGGVRLWGRGFDFSKLIEMGEVGGGKVWKFLIGKSGKAKWRACLEKEGDDILLH